MPVARQPWRCRYTDGKADITAPCWIASERGPRLAIDRVGGCLARTVEEAEQCAAETAGAGDQCAAERQPKGTRKADRPPETFRATRRRRD